MAEVQSIRAKKLAARECECRHFTGVQHETCGAGLAYREPSETKLKSLPCIPSMDRGGAECPAYVPVGRTEMLGRFVRTEQMLSALFTRRQREAAELLRRAERATKQFGIPRECPVLREVQGVGGRRGRRRRRSFYRRWLGRGFDLCPQCMTAPLDYGYGLVGGGMGTYTFCSNAACTYFVKTLDEAEDA